MHAYRSVVLVGLASLVVSCRASTSAPTRTEETTASRLVAAPVALNPRLESSFARWEKEGPTGDAEHRDRLQKLATVLRQRLTESKQVDVLFVCTHNSRRSHMAQLLGLAAARRKGVEGVHTFSGGTEVTALNPRAISALERAGFEIASQGEATNPHYSVRLMSSGEPAIAFSKKITDAPNPKSGFVVVMTCSQADAACPVVEGATSRVAIPYDDPKVADGTPEEANRYDERVAQIGRDLAWVFGAVASH